MAVNTSRDSAVCINAILVVLVAEALLFFASAGWAKGAQDKVAAKTTFQEKCAMCHGPDGAGSQVGKSLNVPDLRSPAAKKLTDAQLAQIISDGKGGMPAFKGSLSEEQIHGLVSYVRSLHQKK